MVSNLQLEINNPNETIEFQLTIQGPNGTTENRTFVLTSTKHEDGGTGKRATTRELDTVDYLKMCQGYFNSLAGETSVEKHI